MSHRWVRIGNDRYWLWAYNYQFSFTATRTTFGHGSFIVASSSETFSCGFWCIGTVSSQWNYWNDITSEMACSNETSIYAEWSGKYGFCDRIGGTFTVPSEARVTQAFTVLTTVFTMVAVCAGSSAKVGGGAASQTAGIFSLFSMIFAIVAFSNVASWTYSKDLLNGQGVLPLRARDSANQIVLVPEPVNLWYGPAFWSMITVFIITLFSSITYFAASKALDDDEDIQAGNNNNNYESLPPDSDIAKY